MRARSEVAGSVLLVVGLTACSGSGGSRGDEDRGSTGEADRAVAPGSPASSATGSLPSYPIRLVNPRPYVVLVFASAGAAEVLVDTVAAADSNRVQLVVETDLVRLRAVDLEGNELGSGYLNVTGADDDAAPADSMSPLRWELPPPP